jgi:uncharacterized protein YegL
MKKILSVLALLLFSAPTFAADNIVVLFDTSGSMDERLGNVSKLKAAQDALCGIVDRVGPNVHIGIVTFQGWIVNLGPVDKEGVKKAIRNTRANGGTPLGKYMKDAADALVEARKRDKGIGTFKLVVVTDGAASDGNLLTLNTTHVKARGIIIETIGVGMSDDHSLAKSSKVYMRGDDPESLKNAVNATVAEVGGKGDGLDEENFRIIAPLDPKLCGHVILALTSPPDTAVGEKVPVYTVKDDGTLDNSDTINPNTAVTQAAGGGLAWWAWVLIILGLIVVVIIFLVVFSNQR